MFQAELEALVNVERFSMAPLLARIWPLIERIPSNTGAITVLRSRLGRNYSKVAEAIIRNSFLIELVKVPKIESTKFRVRWFPQLAGDPRECSFEECLAIANGLLSELALSWLDTALNKEALSLCLESPLFPYDCPLDYQDTVVDGAHSRIHRLGNLRWTATEAMLRTLKLRKYLRDPHTSPDSAFFARVLEDKIKIKAYLTDRVLTGIHKTNREKRWETHPRSVHFASRRTCMAIEYTLLRQLCSFEGFPAASRTNLERAGVLPSDLPVFRCPITQDTMSFTDFRQDLLSPTHGKSDFQVGHLNPLKLEVSERMPEQSCGHTPENISWVSADGNRIQGSLSLNEVRTLLERIVRNYEARARISGS